MSTSDLFRNLEWQIKTHLAEKTIENLRNGWSWEMTPEENLTIAVTKVVPFIFENHRRWGEEVVRRNREEFEREREEEKNRPPRRRYKNHPPCNL